MMVSLIRTDVPKDNEQSDKQDVREVFAQYALEHNNLEAAIALIRSALAIADGDQDFPDPTFDNVTAGRRTLDDILDQLDTATSAAALTGTPTGNTTLASFSDVLSPADDNRQAFNASVEGASQGSSFAFDAATQAGQIIPFDVSLNDVVATLPDPATITRPDGWLFTARVSGSGNDASIVAAGSILRFQNGRVGSGATTGEVFLGYKADDAEHAFVHVFKDGTTYTIAGMARLTVGEDARFNGPGTIPGSAFGLDTIIGDAFGSTVDFGGTKEIGGARSIVVTETGARAVTQADAGKIIVYTGAGDTWTIPDLLEGSSVYIENVGTGAVTLSASGAFALTKQSEIPADASGGVRSVGGGLLGFSSQALAENL